VRWWQKLTRPEVQDAASFEFRNRIQQIERRRKSKALCGRSAGESDVGVQFEADVLRDLTAGEQTGVVDGEIVSAATAEVVVLRVEGRPDRCSNLRPLVGGPGEAIASGI